MIKEDLLKEIEKLKERLKEAYVYYEVTTETYEKPKRTRKFYKNYISRRNLWAQIPLKIKWLA